METTRFILASRSPRRQELLKLVIPVFSVVPSQFDEKALMKQELPPEELVLALSFGKAKEVFENGNQDAVVIGGDTVVVSPGNTVFGIPENREDALPHAFRFIRKNTSRSDRRDHLWTNEPFLRLLHRSGIFPFVGA